MKNKHILISIIVPVYNMGLFLKRCIDSIISQSYEDIEIIIINDGSTDNSLEIIEEYSKKDYRIKVLSQQNKGGVIARKNGILAAKGKYCLLMDADDWIKYDAIEILVKYLNKYKDVDIIKFNSFDVKSKKNIKCMEIENEFLFHKENKNEILKLLIYTNKLNNIWNELIKRELFDFSDFVYDKIVHKSEDFQINLQIMQKAKNILYVNDVLYYYYANPNGITHNIYPIKLINCLNDIYYLLDIGKKNFD